MAQIETGSSTAGKANVSSNYELEVHTPTTEANAGFAQMSSEVDSGAVLGSRPGVVHRLPRVSAAWPGR